MNNVRRKAVRKNATAESAISDCGIERPARPVSGARWAGPGGILAADLMSGSAHAQVVQIHELANAVRRQMAQGMTLLALPPVVQPFAEHAQRMVASLLDAWLEAVNAYGRTLVRKVAAPAGYERWSR